MISVKELPRYKRTLKRLSLLKFQEMPLEKSEKPKLREMYHSSNLVDAQNKGLIKTFGLDLNQTK